MNGKYEKWVACYGNATSITDRLECTYTKNLTLRYPVKMCFGGDRLRFHFSNLTGTEDVTISKARVAVRSKEKYLPIPITFAGAEKAVIPAGEEILTDEVFLDITAGDDIDVSIYLGEYTQMNAGTLITGPRSKGNYSYGDFTDERDLPINLTRNTNWFYFLGTIDIYTEAENHALICYGDSITAQSWPDYLSIRCEEEGYKNVSIIRRAVSGTRILREYNCITYAAYGLKGEKRFPVEMNVSGAKAVIIQHGINDIIHPVGEDVNVFRPWSDMPKLEDMTAAVENIYVNHAKALGYKVYSGTLLPIYGWRTYAAFRDELRQEYNNWLRESKIFDGCIDFDAAVRDSENPLCFAKGYDSGDHLHPSESAYEAMANCVPDSILR